MLVGPDGARVEVLVDEPADGAVLDIVLLPSSQRDSRDFATLAGLLAARGLRVLRPQPRGMGGSSAPPADMTLHTLAADVALAIEALGSGARAVVAGHAYGHFVARVAALDHPRRVRGVALLAAAARTFPAGLTADLDLAADATQPAPARRAALARAFFAPGNDPAPWLDGWHPALRSAYRRTAATPPKDRWWPASPVPVLDLQRSEERRVGV
jgi:pimeloyl-ACP methyl ester carboxylesterase